MENTFFGVKYIYELFFVNFLLHIISCAVKSVEGPCFRYIRGLLGILTTLLELTHLVVFFFKGDLCVIQILCH